MEQKTSLTVAAYLDLVNNTLRTIPNDRISIVGEIVDYRVSQGKWINFDLKDEEEDAKISCFATTFAIREAYESGMKIQVTGYPKVYERFGKFSLNVETMQLVGEGALAKAYALLKKKLEEEGLFDKERKRSIPKFVSKIGLITSSEAAAYGDFLRILNNRWGGVEIVHIPVHVQGQYAVKEIVQAFNQFNAMKKVDRPEVVVLTRGGGSLEDLHAFNDEQTARAVFQSKIPVIVGIGHERDESLCDFVADIRASTPSNAAEIVVPDRQDVLRDIHLFNRRMEDILLQEVNRKEQVIDRSLMIFYRFIERGLHDFRMALEKFGYAFERFRLSLIATRQYIESMEKTVKNAFLSFYQDFSLRLQSILRIFETFDVSKVLKRGFAIVRHKDHIVKGTAKLDLNKEIHIQLAQGSFGAKISSFDQETLL